MSALPIREEAIRLINQFSEEELYHVVELLKTIHILPAEDDYDEANDPLMGFFDGPPDLAAQSKAILRKEYGLRKPQDAQDE